MKTLAASMLLLLATASVAHAQAKPDAKPDAKLADASSLEKQIIDAPGPVGCYTNNTGERLIDCETRERGLTAFKKLYESDKKKAIAAIQRRFDEIPSPKGGYFPILAAVTVKDKAFLPALKKLAADQKENQLGVYATEAMRLIETGKCSQVPPPPALRELCM